MDFTTHYTNLLRLVNENTQKRYSPQIAKCAQKFKKVEKNTFIDYTLSKLQPHMKHIIEENEFLFTNDYHNKPLNLLSGIDFKEFWYDLNSEKKTQLWFLLKQVYLSGSFVLGVGLSDPIIRQLMNSAKEEKELATISDEEEEPATTNPLAGLLSMANSPLAGLLNGGNANSPLAGLLGEGADPNNLFASFMNEIQTNPLMDLAKKMAENITIDPNSTDIFQVLTNVMSDVATQLNNMPNDTLESAVNSFKTNIFDKLPIPKQENEQAFEVNEESINNFKSVVSNFNMADVVGQIFSNQEMINLMKQEEQDKADGKN